jgi:hypothetical protein
MGFMGGAQATLHLRAHVMPYKHQQHFAVAAAHCITRALHWCMWAQVSPILLLNVKGSSHEAAEAQHMLAEVHCALDATLKVVRPVAPNACMRRLWATWSSWH